MAGADDVAEAGGEAFYLIFDNGGEVFGRACGYVAIGPGGVFVAGRAGVVEDALLGEEYERFVVAASVPGGVFGRGYFVEGVAEVDGAGEAAGFGGEGYGFVECPVDLEYAHAIPIAL